VLRGFFSIASALGLAALALPALAATSHQAVVAAVPAKQLKAVRRLRMAAPEAAPRFRRSRNKPPRRQLRANRLHISRRVRRRHRRRAA
jgi:hypothetical protein